MTKNEININGYHLKSQMQLMNKNARYVIISVIVVLLLISPLTIIISFVPNQAAGRYPVEMGSQTGQTDQLSQNSRASRPADITLNGNLEWRKDSDIPEHNTPRHTVSSSRLDHRWLYILV